MADEEHKLEHKIISETDADKAAELLNQYINDGWSVRASHYQAQAPTQFIGPCQQHFVFVLSRCRNCHVQAIPHLSGSIN
jgi:hypothetical protein